MTSRLTSSSATRSPLRTPPLNVSAAAAVWRRMRARAGRTALFMLVLCACIALIINSFSLTGIGRKAVYSFAIGGSCWLINEGVRLGLAWGYDLWFRLRRQAGSEEAWPLGWAGILPGTVLCFLLGPILGLTLGDLLTSGRSASLWNLQAVDSRVTLAVTLLSSVLAVVVFSSIERLASARAKAEAAQRLASETKLRLLQSQLEPHMLFNTLANLRVLIGLDATRAQDMLDHLIAFLRATLVASRSGEHALGTEFDRIGDYLALMAVRMGPRLQVRLHLPDALGAINVPPLLLQPLVENSIQHGLEPQVAGGWVEVRAEQHGSDLVLSVSDNGVGCAAAPTQAPAGDTGRGFGLTGTRERLATLYGTRASLTLQAMPAPDSGTRVILRMPMPMPSSAIPATDTTSTISTISAVSTIPSPPKTP